MQLKEQALHGLNKAREFTNMILGEFKTDEQWHYRTTPKANHALWVAGHLALADNHFAAHFRPDTGQTPDGWEELFWYGSEIKDDVSAYPPPADVLKYMQDRRDNLLNVINDLSEEELAAAAPGPDERSAIAGAPNVGQLLFFAAFHEGIHTGQLTVCHRGLGNEPLMKPEPAEAS